MTIEYDAKGKSFTDIITKFPIPAMIQTVTHRIHGTIHIRKGQRIKTELDDEERFMAVTSATIYSMSGEALYQTDFLAVQRSQIVWVIPDYDPMKSAKRQDKE